MLQRKGKDMVKVLVKLDLIDLAGGGVIVSRI